MPGVRIVIFPYRMSSRSAKLLSSELNALRVFPDKNYRPRENHKIFNWGNSIVPNWMQQARRIINNPRAVAIAGNKAYAFDAFRESEVRTPEFTGTKSRALSWIEDGSKVVCRQVLSGHSGKGIVVAEHPSELVDAPLYTRLVPKDKEYRVHVYNGNVIDFVQKKKRNDVESSNPYIRSHENGWVFARQDVQPPDGVFEESIKAVDALGLDFGAVDIATTRSGGIVVFEVNTAPGIEGTTLRKYAEAFSRREE